MATVANLQVVIGANTKQLQKEIEGIQKTMRQKLGGRGFGVSKTALAGITGLTAALSGLGVMAVRSAAQMEQIEKAFTTLLKDAKLAKTFLGELESFAANTPFELPGVLNASKRLLAFGFTAQQVIPILTAIGDSAAALGMGEEGINRLTTAIGQIQAKAKVSAEEMNQINETGIPAWRLLADTIGVTVPQAMDMASKGMIDGATGVQAILSGMNKEFGGMMAEQAQTLDGMMSNIRDSVNQTMTVVGKDIVEGLDLKATAKSFQDTLGEFTAIAKQSGVAEAIKEMVPVKAGMAVAALAAVITGTAVPAMVLLSLQAAKMSLAFVGITGPIGAAIAAIGAGAYYLWANWEDVGKKWETFWTNFDHSTAHSIANVRSLIAELVATAADATNKIGGFFGFDNVGSGLQNFADELERKAEALRKTADSTREAELKAIQAKYTSSAPQKSGGFASADIDNLGLQSGTATGGGVSAEISREIDRLNEKLIEAKEKTLDLQSDFRDFNVDIKISGMSEFDQVYAGIVKERDARIASVNDWQAKFSNAVTEAQQLYERAMKTGDANVIANALAMLEQRKLAQIAATQEASTAQLQINQTMNEQLLAQDTLMNAYKAELDALQRETNLEAYVAYLDAEKAAFMQNQMEQQELMSQYYNWRLEAEQSYLSFGLEAANTLKNGLASGFANAIVYGKNLGKTMQDLGKQIVAMFIQWQVQRMAAAALSKAAMGQETAAVAAQGAKMAASLAPAAWAKIVVSPGSAGTATSILTSGMAGAAGIGAASNAITAFSSDEDFNPGYVKPPHFANGGIVTGYTLGVIGEKSYDEAVIPLRSSTLEALGSYITPAATGNKNVGAESEQAVGNIVQVNISAIDAESFAGFLERGGGDVIRQMLFNNSRNFGELAGVW